MPKMPEAGNNSQIFARLPLSDEGCWEHQTLRKHVSEYKHDSYKVGFKKPPKHGQFKKGRSGNPDGRPRKYDAAAERRQLKALLALMATRSDSFPESGTRKSSNYILWLIKELEIQIRLQLYDRLTEVSPASEKEEG
jgi:hypothetical protein